MNKEFKKLLLNIILFFGCCFFVAGVVRAFYPDKDIVVNILLILIGYFLLMIYIIVNILEDSL